MNPAKLHFQDIDLRRMPGFPSGGFRVTDLSPGVNIVYGPNSSGKTTLGRAICKLLRPADPPHQERSLRATLKRHEQRLTVDVDYGSVRCQADGNETDLPVLVSAEFQDRYVLALHDLISAEDGGALAAQIIRESAGGYDLKRARTELKFQDRPRGKSKLNRELNDAKEKVKLVSAEQESLLRQERKLLELSEKRDKVDAARDEVEWVNKALARNDAYAKLHKVRQQMALFPRRIAELSGVEDEQLKKLRESLDEWKKSYKEESNRRAKARAVLVDSILPRDGVQLRTVSELRLKCQRLSQLATTISTDQQELAHAEMERERASERLGLETIPGAADSLKSAEIDRLLEFVRRADEHCRQQESITRLQGWLDVDVNSGGLDSLQRGIELLRDWRSVAAVRNRAKSPRLFLFIAATACGILSAAFVVVFHWSWLLLLLAAFGLLVRAFVPQKVEDRLEQLRREFDVLPLDNLSEWTEKMVAERLWRLQEMWKRSAVDDEKKKYWTALSANVEELERQQAKLDRERATWTTRLGFSEQTINAKMYLLACWIQEFQAATDRCCSEKAKITEAQRQHSDGLSDIRQTLQKYNLDGGTNAEQAAATVEHLVLLCQTHTDAVKSITECEKNLPDIERHIEQIAKDIRTLFSDLGLEEDDDVTLQQWLDQRSEFREVSKQEHEARGSCQHADSTTSSRADLYELSRDELVKRRSLCQQSAVQWQELNDEIVKIKERISVMEKQTDLEAALATQQQCKDQLRDQRDEDCEAMVGSEFVGFLAQLERGGQQSKVFQKAAALFVEITHGRYELLIDDGDPPAFRARDTACDVGLALDKLSSGTRLQLLLAVRVAFVEQQELQFKIPLIFDEILANSDERRAESIMHAAIKLCRGGRQIFYFTAQHDEVGKWEAILNSYDDVPHRVIDLAELRGFSEIERVPPMPIQVPEKVEIPAPETDDWPAYGRRLRIPPIDPNRDVGGVHLWYLIDNVEMLYRLLRQGVNRWGQFQTLIGYGQGNWLTKESPVFQRASSLANILVRAVEYWRVGRGKLVDRDVLNRSDCVTSRFIDKVVDLAETLGGDPRAIINALEDGRVRGFKTKKRYELAEYLDAEGYLDERNKLTPEQILDQVRPAAFDDLDRGFIDVSRMEELVRFVTRIDETRDGGIAVRNRAGVDQ